MKNIVINYLKHSQRNSIIFVNILAYLQKFFFALLRNQEYNKKIFEGSVYYQKN